jgi:hypothetical protein
MASRFTQQLEAETTVFPVARQAKYRTAVRSNPSKVAAEPMQVVIS